MLIPSNGLEGVLPQSYSGLLDHFLQKTFHYSAWLGEPLAVLSRTLFM